MKERNKIEQKRTKKKLIEQFQYTLCNCFWNGAKELKIDNIFYLYCAASLNYTRIELSSESLILFLIFNVSTKPMIDLFIFNEVAIPSLIEAQLPHTIRHVPQSTCCSSTWARVQGYAKAHLLTRMFNNHQIIFTNISYTPVPHLLFRVN